MSQKIVAGNWKMNCTHEEAVTLTRRIMELLQVSDPGSVRIMLAPPLVHLGAVRFLTTDEKRISVAAQNCAAFASGAYTGEVSAAMIASVGASAVIIGHSERRKYFGESSAVLRDKLQMAYAYGLEPIFCCGETREEREEGRHFETVSRQISESLFGFSEKEIKKTMIAYEPVWAIGTGLTATPEQAQEMHAAVRKLLQDRYGDIARSIPLLYGGSCNEKNAARLFSRPDIDGGLIGGASLNPESFIKIVTSFEA